MKVDIIQNSFAAGEIGPSVLGRSDIAQWDNACQTVQNFLPRLYGSAISMPGTRYVATVSDSSLVTRIIPFVFNQADAYVIEMGDKYMRFYTNRGQVVAQSGTEDLSTYSANLIAHYKCNTSSNSSTVIDAVGSHDGTASTLTSSMSTTGIVGNAFDLGGLYHISVADSIDFTRTASTQPMTILYWAYYDSNGAKQTLVSKAGEYEWYIDSTGKINYSVTSGGGDAKLLIHADGADGGTSFTDSSGSGHTVTANGNAQTDTAQYKFGTASALFDGTGDYLSIPNSADWQLGTGDFTVDFWIRWANLQNSTPIDIGDGGGASGLKIRFSNTNKRWELYANASEITDTSHSHTPAADTWYHFAVTRTGSTLKLYINGSKIGNTESNSTNITCGTTVLIGKAQTGGDTEDHDGWIDEVRIVKGVAVWTADSFTVPSDPYEGAVSNIWTSDSALDEGWHFLSAVFAGDGTSSSDLAIYVDGDSAQLTFDDNPSYVRMSDTANLFRIGTSSAAGANSWNDKVDNIAVIHQALSSTQIAALYTTSVYQLTTVFTANEVSEVQYTQLNDVVWLTHPNHPPQKLVRTSANEWAIADFAFTAGPFKDTNTDNTISITASATTGTVNLTVTPTNSNLFTVSGSTLGHHNALWMIGGLAQTNTTTGLQEYGFVKITDVINSYTATATVIKNLKTATATTEWAEGAWSAVAGYPSSVVFHERRLWFARTNTEPEHIWGSKVFVFEDYGLGTQTDDDALNLHLASNQSNEIQWLAAGRALIAGTFGGGFVVKSGDSSIITPDNATATEELGIGASNISPKKLGNFIYYVQRFKKKLREMYYNWDLDAYKAADRTILAPHILEAGVTEMDIQENPDSVLHCVLDDGTIASMTREVDQELTAWSRHTTDGTYTSIAIIPSQASDYDEAWVIVERWINGSRKKYIEFFEDVVVPTRQDKCLYLHSALTYDAYETTTTSNVTISLSASSGSVTLTASSAYFDSQHVNRTIRAINTTTGATVGEGEITATGSTTSITLSITTTFNALSYMAGEWGMSVRTVAGLSHLSAKTVGIIADGQVDSVTKTVASSSVTLGSLAFVISVGLSYDQVIYTLPKEAATNRGTAQSKFQRYNEIAFKVNRSTQDFKYGIDADNLDSVNTAFVPTVTTLYTGYLPTAEGGLAMRGGYKRGAQIYIKNSNPLPIELLQIVGTLDTKDK